MVGRGQTSKKRSAASSKRQRSSAPPVFFIDECLGGPILATALRAAGAGVMLCRDHFLPGAPDAEWLPVVGERVGCPDEGQAHASATARD